MKKIAELKQVKMETDDAIQYITDSMANNLNVKIEYENSGWRTIQPYSFTTSKDNNLLVMCYKMDGSVRSYRYDRILQLYVEDSLFGNETGSEFSEADNPNHSDPADYEIPYLPEYDEILEFSEQEDGEPFNEAISDIESTEIFEPNPVDDKGNIITDFDEIQKIREKEEDDQKIESNILDLRIEDKPEIQEDSSENVENQEIESIKEQDEELK